MFFAAPFIGLAYLIALPFVGGAMLAWFGMRAAMEYSAVRNTSLVVKNVGFLAVAPLVGLTSVVLLPFAGLAALAWLGGRALVEHRKARKLIRSA